MLNERIALALLAVCKRVWTYESVTEDEVGYPPTCLASERLEGVDAHSVVFAIDLNRSDICQVERMDGNCTSTEIFESDIATRWNK